MTLADEIDTPSLKSNSTLARWGCSEGNRRIAGFQSSKRGSPASIGTGRRFCRPGRSSLSTCGPCSR